MRSMIFVCGIALGAVSFGLARGSVPSKVTDDTAIYQNLSEIQVQKQQKPSFDQDIDRLAKMERRYQERLPNLKDNAKLQSPMKRISAQSYRYSGSKKTVRN
jgi:hypothetical protein